MLDYCKINKCLIKKASEFLIFNQKLNAQEALERNLVTEVIPDSEFQTKAWEKIEAISKLPKEVVD
jgi:enoyl-CoA hydratase/carnithine racemase